jgi:hypothetical protein
MRQKVPRLLVVACALTLVSLALLAWAILHPAPIPVIAAMSLGQGLGTIGALLFVIVVVSDLRVALRAPAKNAVKDG